MKVRKLFIALVFMLPLLKGTVMAQQYKILKAASKEFLSFAVLYDRDKDEVFGYIELSRSIRPAKKMEKIYYTVLDKNLNKIVSGDFDEPVAFNKSFLTVGDISYSKGHIFLEFIEKIKKISGNVIYYENLMRHYEILDLKENKVVNSGIIEDFAKKEGNTIVKTSKRSLKSGTNIYMFTVLSAPNGFLLNYYIYPYKGSLFKIQNIIKLVDFKGKEIWKKSLVSSFKKKDADKMEGILGLEDKYLYTIKIPARPNTKFTETLTDELVARSLENGDVLANHHIKTDNKYSYKVFFSNLKNGKIVFSGRYRDKKRSKSHRWLGIFRDVYVWDGKSFNRKAYQFLPFSKMKLPNINEYGKVKNEGYLYFADVDVLDNDEMIYIAETSVKNYYKGLYLFLMNKDFEVVTAKSLITEPSKFPKYRFSHKLQNDKGRIFVFYDKDSRSKYNIHIVKYLFDTKKFTESVINVNLRNGVVRVYPAKKGYIMIVEKYFKPKKDGKLMEIRLEKI